jgi:hypothetical protein
MPDRRLRLLPERTLIHSDIFGSADQREDSHGRFPDVEKRGEVRRVQGWN